MKKKVIIGTVMAAVAAVAAMALTGNRTELKINTATVAEETVEITVTATGNVQPVEKVEVGTQVSGVIERLYADFNSQVKRGQLLAELDKSTLMERLIQARAAVAGAESELNFAQQNHDRVKMMCEAKAAPQTAYEDAVNRLAQAKTAAVNAAANMQQAQVNLGYAQIYSPIDGVVLHRAVEQGQTVTASFNTPTLFTIANDLKQMHVEANVDEADIGMVRTRQTVRFTVDAYPDDVFAGTVKQIRLQPTVTGNVVTYTVIIEAPNPDEKLFPGMTASVTVIVQSERGLTLPLSAFKFTPDAAVMQKLNVLPSHSQPDAVKSVWVMADGKAARHELETGLNDGISVIVTAGLNADDTVILSASLENKGNQSKQK
jgi:HlyD family secretion protein